MATEEQTSHNVFGGVYDGGVIRSGQRLTIPNRVVSKLSFPVAKYGSPTGDVTLGIRQLDNTLLCSKVWGDVSSLAAYPTVTWIEVEFDTPQFINEEVIIYVEFTEGDGSNCLIIYTQSTDVKANEYKVQYVTSWASYTHDDDAYIYTYEAGVAPTVTTQAVTDIAPTTATGNGNVTNLGLPNATQHGHCWSTSQNPTISDDKTENGAPGATGAFTSSMVNLLSGTKYYVRAYITNDWGTVYGAEVDFTTIAVGFPYSQAYIIG